MQTNNHQLVDYDAVLDAKFGAKSTASRLEAEEKAYAFYTGQIIGVQGKKAKITQVGLARRIGSIFQGWKVGRQSLKFKHSIGL